MFAINHATTALAIRRGFPGTSLLLLLASVQAMEVLWVILNIAGIEITTTEAQVRSVADIHLAHMPWSHSLLMTFVAAAGLGAVATGLTKRLKDGVAVAIGVASHLLLDWITHAPDLALAPFAEDGKFGLGLYPNAPLAAFGLELLWGLFCVVVHGGGRWLYTAVAFLNLANLTLFMPGVAGPESAVAGRPMLLVVLVATQILLTLGLVFALGDRRAPLPPLRARRSGFPHST